MSTRQQQKQHEENLKPREAKFLVQRHKAISMASPESDSKSSSSQCAALEVSGQAV